jgi:hypothetical protein
MVRYRISSAIEIVEDVEQSATDYRAPLAPHRFEVTRQDRGWADSLLLRFKPFRVIAAN